MPSAPLSPRAARIRRTVSVVLGLSAVVIAALCLVTIVTTFFFTDFFTSFPLPGPMLNTAVCGIGLVVILAAVALTLADQPTGSAARPRVPMLLGNTALILSAACVLALLTPLIYYVVVMVWLAVSLL
jgi:hypothetical protein